MEGESLVERRRTEKSALVHLTVRGKEGGETYAFPK